MNENKVYPDWVTDPQLFAGYMEDIHFFKQPFSWDVRPTCKEAPLPTPVMDDPAKSRSLSSLVGSAWRMFIDDMKAWL